MLSFLINPILASGTSVSATIRGALSRNQELLLSPAACLHIFVSVREGRRTGHQGVLLTQIHPELLTPAHSFSQQG